MAARPTIIAVIDDGNALFVHRIDNGIPLFTLAPEAALSFESRADARAFAKESLPAVHPKDLRFENVRALDES
jgi:hypothetical protein